MPPSCPQVRQYRKLLLETCLCALRGVGGTSVPCAGMEALATILAELRDRDLGSFFDAISQQCRSFFDNVSWTRASLGPGPRGARQMRVGSRQGSRARSMLAYRSANHGILFKNKTKNQTSYSALEALLPAPRG